VCACLWSQAECARFFMCVHVCGVRQNVRVSFDDESLLLPSPLLLHHTYSVDRIADFDINDYSRNLFGVPFAEATAAQKAGACVGGRVLRWYLETLAKCQTHLLVTKPG